MRRIAAGALATVLGGMAVLGPGHAEQSLVDPATAGMCRLMARNAEYHRLIRKGSIKQLSRLRSSGAPDITEGEARYLKGLTGGLKDYGGEVVQVWLRGDRARARQRVTGKYRKRDGKWDLDQQVDWYWIFERGDWYRLPMRPRDWEQEKAVRVVLPHREDCE